METIKLQEEVLKALDEIRPFLQRDGGDVAFDSIEGDHTVNVRLVGTCAQCNINTITLKMGVENTIKKYAPTIKNVIDLGPTEEEMQE